MENLSKQLPDTLHELIVLAVNDMKATEKNKSYYIDMRLWHYRKDSESALDIIHSLNEKKLKKAECIVCMAGCVMAQTLGVPINKDMSPNMIGGRLDKTRVKLGALDCIRDYNIYAAINCMYGDSCINPIGTHVFVMDALKKANRVAVFYEEDKRKFYSNMLFIAKLLKSQRI